MASNGNDAPPLPPAPPQDGAARVARIELADLGELGVVTQQANVQFHQAQAGAYRGGLLDLEVEGVGIQWGRHDLAITSNGEVWAQGAFLAVWSGAEARANGHEMRSGLIYYPPGSEHQSRTDGPLSWVSLRVADLGPLAAALAPGLDLASGSPVRYVGDAPQALAAVRRLLEDARRAADAGGDPLRHPAARRALRATLGAALVRVLAEGPPARRGESAAASSALVRRAVEWLRAEGFQPVLLPELCAALGTSETRLRAAFLKIYGLGPTRFLRLRRLHLVRRALRTTREGALTVSAAAASHGFYEFGRFAGEYRALFGELPSRTPRAR